MTSIIKYGIISKNPIEKIDNEGIIYYNIYIFRDEHNNFPEIIPDNFNIEIINDTDIFYIEYSSGSFQIVKFDIITPMGKKQYKAVGEDINLKCNIILSHSSNFISEIRLATDEEIKHYNIAYPLYKVGDWVIVEGYNKNYDGKPLKIHTINIDINK